MIPDEDFPSDSERPNDPEPAEWPEHGVADGPAPRHAQPPPHGESGQGEEASRVGKEAPYIAAVLLVLLALLASLFAPGHVQRVETAPTPTHPEEAFLEHEATAFLSAINMALIAGGLVCLSFIFARLRSPQPLIKPRDAAPARWIWWDLLKVLAVQQALLILLISFLPPPANGPGRGFWLSSIIASFAAAALAIRVAVVDRRSPPASLGLTAKNWPLFVVIGAVAFLAFWPIHVGVMTLGGWIMQSFAIRLPPQDVVVMFAEVDDPLTLLLLACSALIVAPVVEELFFRGMLIPLLERHMRGWLAILLSALVFGAFHFNLRAFVPISLLGLGLGYVFWRTRSLVAPIAFHFFYNVVALVLIFMVRMMNA